MTGKKIYKDMTSFWKIIRDPISRGRYTGLTMNFQRLTGPISRIMSGGIFGAPLAMRPDGDFSWIPICRSVFLGWISRQKDNMLVTWLVPWEPTYPHLIWWPWLDAKSGRSGV